MIIHICVIYVVMKTMKHLILKKTVKNVDVFGMVTEALSNAIFFKWYRKITEIT